MCAGQDMGWIGAVGTGRAHTPDSAASAALARTKNGLIAGARCGRPQAAKAKRLHYPIS